MESEEFDFFEKLDDLGIEIIFYKGEVIYINPKYNTSDNSNLSKSVLPIQENATEK